MGLCHGFGFVLIVLIFCCLIKSDMLIEICNFAYNAELSETTFYLRRSQETSPICGYVVMQRVCLIYHKMFGATSYTQTIKLHSIIFVILFLFIPHTFYICALPSSVIHCK